MVHIRGTADFELPEYSSVTIGKFDGIHLGHQILIEAAVKAAAQNGWHSVVFTFAASPRQRLNQESQGLMTSEEKAEFLERMGVEYLIEYPFTDEVQRMSPEQFLEDVLYRQLHIKYLAVGEDFRFGYQRKGDCFFLKKYAVFFHFHLDIYEKLKYNKRDISSSFIRERIRLGDMEAAQEMLGRPYSFDGFVEHGKELGRTIGFPTLNLIPDGSKVLPPNGVYFAEAELEGESYFGVANLGIQPTVDRHCFMLEVHVLNFKQMVYGKPVRVKLYRFQRPERHFEGIAALKEQLQADRDACIRFFEK